jgi:hypothetical protein
MQHTSGVPRNFRGERVQQIHLRIEGRTGSGGGSPQSGVPLYLQMSETRILIRLLRMYFPRNWEFGSALSKLCNFGAVRGVEPQPPRYATATHKRKQYTKQLKTIQNIENKNTKKKHKSI